jgi:hypothetical protein
MAQPNDPPVIGNVSQVYSGVAQGNLDEIVDFSSAQKKLNDAINLLQSTRDIFDRHQCYSRSFEIALWQENNKLNQVLQVNRALVQQVEELRYERNHKGWHEDTLESKPEVFEEKDGCLMQGDESSSVGLNFDAGDMEEPLTLELQETGHKNVQKERQQRNKNKLKRLAGALLFGSK